VNTLPKKGGVNTHYPSVDATHNATTSVAQQHTTLALAKKSNCRTTNSNHYTTSLHQETWLVADNSCLDSMFNSGTANKKGLPFCKYFLPVTVCWWHFYQSEGVITHAVVTRAE